MRYRVGLGFGTAVGDCAVVDRVGDDVVVHKVPPISGIKPQGQVAAPSCRMPLVFPMCAS